MRSAIFTVDLAKLLLHQLVDIFAGLVVLIREGEQFPHLRHAEAELPCSPDESQRRQAIV